MVPADEHGEQALTLHISAGDVLTLLSSDASVLRKTAMVRTAAVSSRAKIVIFWLAIVAAVILVYLAVGTRH